jgi:ferritin-like metal-binding protein YciE
MEKMIDLRDLLKHEIIDLYSVEEQIIAALPDMIDKAGNPTLKRLLREHLKVTEKQKSRLDEVKQLLNADQFEEETPGFFSRIFGGGNDDERKCIGMEGIIKEGEKIISHDMSPEALDAAIIAAAQKVEHYEICGYGTAVAYSRELRLYEITTLLEKSLDEEYIADNSLTNLAVGQLNVQAEFAGGEDIDDNAPLSEPKKVTKKRTTTSPKAKSASKSTTSRRSAPSVTKKLGNGRSSSSARKTTSSSARTKSSATKRRRTTSKRK